MRRGGNLQGGGGDIGAALAPPVNILKKGLPDPVVSDLCKFAVYQLHQILYFYSSVGYILIIKWIILNSVLYTSEYEKQGVRCG